MQFVAQKLDVALRAWKDLFIFRCDEPFLESVLLMVVLEIIGGGLWSAVDEEKLKWWW